MAMHIKEAFPRIDDALDSGRTVLLSDGTDTARVVKAFGDADDIEETELVLALENLAVVRLQIDQSGFLAGISMQDTEEHLLILKGENEK